MGKYWVVRRLKEGGFAQVIARRVAPPRVYVCLCVCAYMQEQQDGKGCSAREERDVVVAVRRCRRVPVVQLCECETCSEILCVRADVGPHLSWRHSAQGQWQGHQRPRQS